MNRIMIAVAVAVFAMSGMLARPAEAGMKGRLAVGLAIGAIGVMAHEHRKAERRKWKKKRYEARRRATKKVYTAKKKSTPKVKEVAKAEPAPLPKQKVVDAAVENENSSISTAALAPVEETASINETEAETVNVVAEVPETEPVAVQETAKKLDCKKFFPTVGMTLSVPCE
jgi:hypothetical protein